MMVVVMKSCNGTYVERYKVLQRGCLEAWLTQAWLSVFWVDSDPLCRGKYVPETQCLIARACNHRAAIVTHSHIQYTGCVACQCSKALHSIRLPDNDLVRGAHCIVSIAVCWYNIVRFFRPGNITDLRASVMRRGQVARDGVPELDCLICGTAATDQNTTSMWIPSNGFHGSRMLRKSMCNGIFMRIPYEEIVVVAAGCKHGAFWIPFQTTHLLSVSH